MAAPIKGLWLRRQSQPYAGGNWATGINPVHYQYGSAPLRQTPLHGEVYSVTAPNEAIPDSYEPTADWGYTPEDLPAGNYIYDLRPAWTTEPDDNVWRSSTDDMPPVNASGGTKNSFRSLMRGARRIDNNKDVNTEPSETVTEGWRNKPKGVPADSKPSDPSQYERQTAMQQRYAVRSNKLALMRLTDEPRAEISSRVVGQRIKIYSGEERHDDMQPKEQNDIPRPFYYRTAGTGPAEQMEPNAMYVSEAIQRNPPSDPSLGPTETSSQFDFGYTQEDMFYA